MIKIPNTTQKPRFYIAVNRKEAFSSWDTIEEARACLNRFKAEAPDDYKHVMGIIETNEDAIDYRDHIFHAKGIKPIERHTGGMKDGDNVYVATTCNQGIFFYLISFRLWNECESRDRTISEAIEALFPAQEDDIYDEPEVTEHARLFLHLIDLLKFVEKHGLKIVNSREEH